ncbi:hypothetical protein MIR68_004450 [Amoeboaphelidium protococcarum]|nr:hypothetical protein MIR68_004450 [Amoeboaphelidium protococcarum]
MQQQLSQLYQHQDDPILQPSSPQGKPAPITVGSVVALPERFLAEGGFARVYLARGLDGFPLVIKMIQTSSDGVMQHQVMNELALMKQLKHPNIVRYIDSSVMGGDGRQQQQQQQQYSSHGLQVYIAMEFCVGGGLVDMMNRRLSTRLQESEVWTIFSQVVDATAFLHYQNQPIVHRDLKVENVLIQVTADGSTLFKLCDFGSCTTRTFRPVQSLSAQDMSALQEDIDRFTTIQYRSPEMCDLYRIRKCGLGTKSDVWALGVLLYKLCYFVNPFNEEDGKLAILNAKYRFPSSSPNQFSQLMLDTIRRCLTVDALYRPNIYQLMAKVYPGIGRSLNYPPLPADHEANHEQYVNESVNKDLPSVPQQSQQAVQNDQYEASAVDSNVRRGRVKNSGQNGHRTQASVDAKVFENAFDFKPEQVQSRTVDNSSSNNSGQIQANTNNQQLSLFDLL